MISVTINYITCIIINIIIYTITNWRVSLSIICHEWSKNAVNHEWAQRMSELQC
jgi:hypothetical protein